MRKGGGGECYESAHALRTYNKRMDMGRGEGNLYCVCPGDEIFDVNLTLNRLVVLVICCAVFTMRNVEGTVLYCIVRVMND